MKTVIIAIIGLVILLAILAFWLRRKHINQIGKLEKQKLEIQHKPIFEEMMKVKELNMTGETEEKFERWRTEWTEVMDIHMPELDNLLFDVEEFVDRFKYKKATETEEVIEGKIQSCHKKMNEILVELEELVGSEEKNRFEMEALEERHRAARKKILAHQPSFGLTVEPLEKELELFKPKIEEYYELTEHGNYLQAREIVISLTEKGSQLFSIIEQLPSLLADIQNKIPAAIRELRNGTREMEEQSYYLNHLELPKHFTAIEEKLANMLKRTEKLEMDSIQEETTAINDQIDSFYDALEKEVISKQFVDSHYESVSEKLVENIELTQGTVAETAFVQKSYRLNDEESKIPQKALEELEELKKKFDVISTQIENGTSAYSILQEEIQLISEKLTNIEQDRKKFANHIKNLRNDENDVRTKLEQLTRKLQDTDRSLRKGNIPGIPGDMDARLEEAEEQIYIVTQSLQEVPLNMSLVNSYLENAKQSVDEVSMKAKELLENVVLIEWIIQYGNRYRASNKDMNERLLEAEESFRQFRYAKALEEAATAVEEVEPGAMKRIEELVQENS